MAHAERDRKTDLGPADLDALARVQFFQLVDLLQGLYPDATRVGSTRSPAREAVRFKANATFGFPSSEVASVSRSAEIPDGLEVRLNLIGLYGPSSPLPTSYTERIIHAESSNALGDFLDLFNHRLAGLLYLVWRHYQHHVRYERQASDAISQAVAALFGLPPLVGEAAADERRTMLLPYAGLLSMNSRSATSISRVIAHFFGVPCDIEEFIPRWIAIPENARFTLGETDVALGADTILGDTMQDVTGHFRIWCGPLSFARYKEFLPNRPENAELRRLIDFVLRDPLSCDVGFLIEAGTTPEWSLGEGELGWTTWAVPRRDAPIELVI